jgi:hypothetical protein
MKTGSSSATDPRASERRARAWYLFAQFDVVMHPRLANSDKDQVLPEYVREVIAARDNISMHAYKDCNSSPTQCQQPSPPYKTEA